MAGTLLQWALLVLLSPVLLVLPGYLALRILGKPSLRSSTEEVSVYETVGLSAALSLSFLVLVAFLLSQTLGLSRATLVGAHLLLLAGLGAFGVSSDRLRRDEAAPRVDASAVPGPRRLSALLLGASLLLVVAGVGVFDGSEPYSEVYYANASEVPKATQVPAGAEVAWRIAVENHEQSTRTYRIETRLIPNGTTNETEASGTLVDQAELEVEHGQAAERVVRFTAPDCCIWKAKTLVYVEDESSPLTVHRWVHVGTA